MSMRWIEVVKEALSKVLLRFVSWWTLVVHVFNFRACLEQLVRQVLLVSKEQKEWREAKVIEGLMDSLDRM